ncbi:MAG: hypothetical protein AAF903_09180 [Pseudomonadota bacterium]
MRDLAQFPLSSGVMLGLIGYGIISVFGTGQLIGDRLIQRSDWQRSCQQVLTQEIMSQQTVPQSLPQLDCNALLGGFLGKAGKEVCHRYGGLTDPLFNQMKARQDALRRAAKSKLTQAKARTSSRCGCAATKVLDQHKFAFGIHAGSLRIVTPRPVHDLQSSLQSALHSPSCKIEGGAS